MLAVQGYQGKSRHEKYMYLLSKVTRENPDMKVHILAIQGYQGYQGKSRHEGEGNREHANRMWMLFFSKEKKDSSEEELFWYQNWPWHPFFINFALTNETDTTIAISFHSE